MSAVEEAVWRELNKRRWFAKHVEDEEIESLERDLSTAIAAALRFGTNENDLLTRVRERLEALSQTDAMTGYVDVETEDLIRRLRRAEEYRDA